MRRFSLPVLLFLISLNLFKADTGPSDYSNLDPARDASTPLFANSTDVAEILALQNALAGVTYPIGTEPLGVFDDATAKALLLFQQASSSIPESEYGYVSVYTMAEFDLMLGIVSCPSYGLGRLAGDKVTTEISDGAVATLNSYWDYPIGTEIPFLADNQTYVGRIELHYHPWGGSIKPYGYHHGVSVFYYTDSLLGLTGSEFLDLTANMTIAQREAHILLQYALLNIPSTIKLFNVTLTSEDASRSVTFSVASDYLAIGTADDNVRFPAAAYTAQMIANLHDTSVPTTKMVDAIWAAAAIKLDPQPISPSDTMCSNAYVVQENTLIETQLAALNSTQKETLFISGDKKDTVLTNQYAQYPTSVAEYGWHQSNGEPIQPLYMGHSADWADYSMGIRMVQNKVWVDGTTVSTLQEVLANEELAGILSAEGVMTSLTIPIQKRAATTCWDGSSSYKK